MKLKFLKFLGVLVLMHAGCVPVEKIVNHDFDSGFYTLKTHEGVYSHVYTNVIEDSIVVYPVTTEGKKKMPDLSSSRATNIKRIDKGNYFYRSCFINNSFDVDLTTVLLKYRPALTGVPDQLSADLNVAIYAGFRKDYFKFVPYVSPLKVESTFLSQIGFNGGIYAGIGTTPINSTVTDNKITQAYDGMVLLYGMAGFITFNNMSVGLALGADNLLNNKKSGWIYNRKPYLGIIIGISNF